MKIQIRQSWMLSLVVVLLLLGTSMVVGATGNFVTIILPKGASIQLPKNWVVLSENQRITLDTLVESGLDLSGRQRLSSELAFAANYYDDRGNTVGILNVRYYPQLDLSQADARNATNQDVMKLDTALKENITKEMKTFGMSITSWIGTTKTEINGVVAFITEYRRASIRGPGDFRVRLIRIFAGHNSFTLTISYLERAAPIMRLITDRVIRSLKVRGIGIAKGPMVNDRSSATTGLWFDKSEGFGAMFPGTPEKINAETGQLAAYAFQSSKAFTNGGALYAITVVPLPAELKETNFNSFLKTINDAFIKSMGQDPNSAKVWWSDFGDRRKKLEYDFHFVYRGIPFRARGFWLIDRGRAIRVSVGFTRTLSPREAKQVLSFLETFVVVKK